MFILLSHCDGQIKDFKEGGEPIYGSPSAHIEAVSFTEEDIYWQYERVSMSKDHPDDFSLTIVWVP